MFPCTSVYNTLWTASLISLKALLLLRTYLAASCTYSPTFLPSPFLEQLLFDLVLGNQAHKNANTHKKSKTENHTSHNVTENKRVIFPPVCHTSFIDEYLKHEKEEGIVNRVGVLWLYFK